MPEDAPVVPPQIPKVKVRQTRTIGGGFGSGKEPTIQSRVIEVLETNIQPDDVVVSVDTPLSHWSAQ